jgi:uncharacterized protein (DUF1778 family)
VETTEHAETRIAKDARLNLRMTAHQDQLIRQAAAAADKSVSDFVLGATTSEAERVLADRRWFLLDDEQWWRFHELLEAPFEADERLVKLMTEPIVIDAIDQ